MKVKIEEFEGTAKFVVAMDSNTGNKILYAEPTATFHYQVLSKLNLLQDYEDDFRRCLGGGRIKIDRKAKTVRAYGYSMDFGTAPQEEVLQALTLEMAKPRWEGYKLTVEMGKGY